MKSSVKKVCDTSTTRITPGLTKWFPQLLTSSSASKHNSQQHTRALALYITMRKAFEITRTVHEKKGGGEIEVSITLVAQTLEAHTERERGTQRETQTKSHTEQDHDLFCTCMLTWSICGVVSIPYSYSVLIITHLSGATDCESNRLTHVFGTHTQTQSKTTHYQSIELQIHLNAPYVLHLMHTRCICIACFIAAIN